MIIKNPRSDLFEKISRRYKRKYSEPGEAFYEKPIPLGEPRQAEHFDEPESESVNQRMEQDIQRAEESYDVKEGRKDMRESNDSSMKDKIRAMRESSDLSDWAKDKVGFDAKEFKKEQRSNFINSISEKLKRNEPLDYDENAYMRVKDEIGEGYTENELYDAYDKASKFAEKEIEEYGSFETPDDKMRTRATIKKNKMEEIFNYDPFENKVRIHD